MTEKYVYSFKEGNKDMGSIMGGKGANLAEMTGLGLNVPPGFTITTDACKRFYEEGEELWDGLKEEIEQHIEEVENQLGKKFSDTENPLLFAVRSGAVSSMPGMMDTVLNLGLNDKAAIGLASSTNNEKLAYDSYRRFIQMFSDVAMNVPLSFFNTILEDVKEKYDVELDSDLSVEALKEIIQKYKQVYKRETGEEFPEDPTDQLLKSITAVFKSWNNPRARIYRDLHHIPHDLGTAVNVQAMVFGNRGETSGTGVAFSRNPSDGDNELFGEFLLNAQGEDVVAGIRTPEEIHQLREIMPEIYEEFEEITENLEKHYKDMQDLEFTIEDGELFILQTRSGKRTTQAAIAIAVDMVEEGLITKEEAILRIDPDSLTQLLLPNFDPDELAKHTEVATGLAASPGAASGKIYFTSEAAVAAKERGEEALIVRTETSPEDIEGMVAVEGILTSRGGMTSHAAVVARGMGKCCVAGASEIYIDENSGTMRIGDVVYKEGDMISLNGTTGKVYEGEIKKIEPELTGKFNIFMEWTDEFKRLDIRSNADSPEDAQNSLDFGAVGIGLTRTEHMFFQEDRILHMRQVIVAESQEDREKALAKLLPIQEEDFYGIFKVMEDKPVTIRLLDPPLHEFLPTSEDDIRRLADTLNVSFEILRDRVNSLQEINPMLGHRGLRLAVTYPEIYRMQVRAIVQAALRINAEGGNVVPEIMIPLVAEVKELEYVKNEVVDEISKVFTEKDDKIDLLIGTMIEIPRAALTSDEIAEITEFFSFGTNDMTQMGYGFSRDDAGRFLHEYLEKDIFSRDPFASLDQRGIGELLKISVERGRSTNPDIKLGVCGEHGGDPSSIEFFHNIGLDYVSCSPFRVPTARLSAAQAALREKNK